MKTYAEIATINVNDHVEKKQNLSYLSWAWAVDQLLRLDGDANWSYGEPKAFGETLMVSCTVTAFGKPRTSHLPVMDHRNKAIQNPDAFAVNTAMMRCLVKAIALHGLGLYIYAGEDLPSEETKTDTNFGVAPKKVTKNGPQGAYVVEQYTDKPWSAGDAIWDGLAVDMQNYLADIAVRVSRLIAKKDLDGALNEVDEQQLADDEKACLWTRFTKDEKAALKAESDKRKERKAA